MLVRVRGEGVYISKVSCGEARGSREVERNYWRLAPSNGHLCLLKGPFGLMFY